MTPLYKVAAVQIAPVFLDRDATIDKVQRYLREAAGAGAKLVVFPEAIVPGYPDWVWSVPPREHATIDALYAELVENAVAIPSAATERLQSAAREAGVFLVIGVNERNTEASGGSLYNTLLFINPEGQLSGRHRKLIPTGGERLMWGQGDGSTLQVYDTPVGKLSGLICWENYMPLARYAMYAWGSRIHVASTWDRGELWLSSIRHIAAEGRMYVISSCQALHMRDIPDRYDYKRFYRPGREWINVGDSAIVDPEGKFVAGPLHEAEGILYADVDARVLQGSRWMLDVAGHYARPDVFRFAVVREAKRLVSEVDVERAIARIQGTRGQSKGRAAGARWGTRAGGGTRVKRGSKAAKKKRSR